MTLQTKMRLLGASRLLLQHLWVFLLIQAVLQGSVLYLMVSVVGAVFASYVRECEMECEVLLFCEDLGSGMKKKVEETDRGKVVQE